MEGLCHKCMGISLLVLSVLVFVNAKMVFLDWPTFIAALLLLKGVLMLVKPHCPCYKWCAQCSASAPASASKAAKKK